MSESDVQSQVLKALRQVGVFALRINSGKAKVSGGWIQLAPAGTADVVAFPRMKLPVWIELKVAKGKQSDAQKEFEQSMRQLGHGYFLIRSLDDLMPLLKEMR